MIFRMFSDYYRVHCVLRVNLPSFYLVGLPGPVQTLMVKINQTQTPVGSIQGGVLQSRENTNPYDDDDDDELCFTDFNVDLLGNLASNSLILSIICHIIVSKQLNDSRIHMHSFDRKILYKVLRKKSLARIS